MKINCSAALSVAGRSDTDEILIQANFIVEMVKFSFIHDEIVNYFSFREEE